MIKNNSLKFMACDKEYKNSKIVMFGAGFDGTVSYRPGTRFAPAAVRAESEGIETFSPYFKRDLNDIKVYDAGDLELSYGNTKKVLKTIENYTCKLLKDDKTPFMIGGEHLVSLPSIKAVCEKYNDLHVIHFDAHADLREEYLNEKLSHASVMKRVWDILGDNKIYQFGIRSGEKEEFEWAKKHTVMDMFNLSSIKKRALELKGKPVYITIDLDVLDPSIFPGTGTPEPGGITFNELMDAFKYFNNFDIKGADIVELSPHYDTSGVSTITACKAIRELLLAI